MDDVIVVGAGPAGNTAAYRLASLGYGVTVVDWRERVGDKLCTGIVGRECIGRFPVDRSLVYRDSSSARVVAPGGEVVEFARDDAQAHVVDRVGYVESFAERARGEGARYLLGYRVTELSCERGYVSVQITDERERRSLSGRALVVASGFGSELTGQLGLGRVGDFVTGVQAEVMAPGVEDIHVYFGREVAPGFFGWLVPTVGGRALVGLLTRHKGPVHLERLLLKLEADGIVKEVTKGPGRWGVPLRPLERTYGERVVVVGDAAGQVKPTTGGGIYYAFLASEIAAEVLDRGLREDDLSACRLREYEREWKSLLSLEMEVGYGARRLFEASRDRQIDFVMHTVAKNGIYKELVGSRAFSFDWHSGAIMKLMGHPIIGKALTHINPILASLAPHE